MKKNLCTVLHLALLPAILFISNHANAQSITSGKYELPDGWQITGGKPQKYLMGIAKGKSQNGSDAITIRSHKRTWSYGAIKHALDPNQYRGKRIRMTGYVRSENVHRWAGLWLRVDDSVKNVVAFDNMADRAITGTTDWAKCTLVLDVPENAKNIVYGGLLNGYGQIWFDDMNIEIVGNDIATTDRHDAKGILFYH